MSPTYVSAQAFLSRNCDLFLPCFVPRQLGSRRRRQRRGQSEHCHCGHDEGGGGEEDGRGFQGEEEEGGDGGDGGRVQGEEGQGAVVAVVASTSIAGGGHGQKELAGGDGNERIFLLHLHAAIGLFSTQICNVRTCPSNLARPEKKDGIEEEAASASTLALALELPPPPPPPPSSSHL